MATLSKVKRQYILHWGEMGTRWGINRTVAQIHALLYLSPTPLTAEEIAETLSVARSNVSTSVRELETWGLVRPVHVLGDRREHYESMKDVWEMFRVIIEQRKKREIDPTMEMLKQGFAELEKGDEPDTYTRERLRDMHEFFESMTGLYEEIRHLPVGALRGVAKMRGKLRKLFRAKAGK
jgi:DNA-binding transcriptional regulator GbsR (MarR family)